MANPVVFWLIWAVALTVSSAFAGWSAKKGKQDVVIGIYIIYLACAQIMAVKLTVLFGFVVPAGTFIFPFIFQIIDSINEHFGLKATQRAIGIAFLSQVLMSLFIWMANNSPTFEYWAIDEEQWLLIFGQTLSITAASWISFLVSNNVDAWAYDWMNRKTKGKHLWVRSTMSDIPMLFIDSVIFITLAFGVFTPEADWAFVGTMIVGNAITKWILGAIDTPFLYLDRFVYERTAPPPPAVPLI
jgi:uncharacterized integral membrane protein (TIGR00697 family)